MSDFTITAPVLETERLILRMWKESDLDAYARIFADEKVMRFLSGETLGLRKTWRHMAFLIGHWALRGFGHWAVEEKASGEFIGRIGYLHPPDYPGFELGWTIASPHWGKGYATEGARAAMDIAFSDWGYEHIISLIAPHNHASKRVAEKLGEVYEGKASVGDHKVEVFGISRETWAQNQA